MGRNLSSIVRQELENLDKDAESRKSAIRALKLYVKDLDSKSIPQFLAQVSETKEMGSSSGEYTISLYENLALVHGVNIVPHIDNIMSTIIKTLSSSAASFSLHQACSKVVPAIARYGIDIAISDDKKRHIIHSLCKPLSDSLLGSQEGLSCGAALCLKALVDSDNWRFASHEMVNEVCLRVAGALEDRPKQSNAHMGLVMALAKHNSLTVEAYARLLIQSGLWILNAGVTEGNSQKRLSAIQMVNFLMRCLDPRSILSEIPLIIDEMERCQSDSMAYVKGAAYEALQTARKIAAEKGSKFDKDVASYSGSGFGRRENSRRRNLSGTREPSPASASAESRTLDSFAGYDSLADSAISTKQVSCNSEYERGSVYRKLWRHENGGVDVSLKDGLFSEMVNGSNVSNSHTLSEHSGQDEFSDNGRDNADGFAGFLQGSPTNGVLRVGTSPQRSHPRLNVDNVMIYPTPRKLVHSLQDPEHVNSDLSEKQRRFQKPPSHVYEWSQIAKYDQNGFMHDMNYELGRKDKSSESVSSTDDVPGEPAAGVSDVDPRSKSDAEAQKVGIVNTGRKKAAINMIFCLLIVLVAALASLLWIEDQEEGFYIVPT